MTAGYSATPLAVKLGIAAGDAVGAFDAPAGLPDLLAPLPPGAVLSPAPRVPCDVTLLFVTSRRGLGEKLPAALGTVPAAGAIWIAWPKRSSGVESDLSEQTLRDVLLPLGLVDNKVCAIDATWSGLRFVVRRENRDAWPPPRI
ncbi:MAG: DUF3052 domain-containing protein [Actinobacteria bacterium]|nr:MAG: DUF3052 domain-containing protein [Actinomycetota bacterium]